MFAHGAPDIPKYFSSLFVWPIMKDRAKVVGLGIPNRLGLKEVMLDCLDSGRQPFHVINEHRKVL